MEKIQALEKAQMKTKLADIRVGDTVRVHQRITEGKKSRVQVFEGLVIRYRKVSSLQAFITVRKITGGIGVEKSWFVHSPNIEKIQVVKRSKVRRAFLSYMRDRRGKSARMAEMGFDKDAVNASDNRTSDDVAKEQKEEITKEVNKEADKDAKDDVMNQPDTISTEEEIKKEQKEASQDDPTPASDNEPKNAPEGEKVASDGNDEQQEAAEEFQQGVDKAEDKTKN